MLPIAGRGGIETTVDQTLMRGLVTAGLWFVSGLPLSHMARVTVSGSQNHNEGCPDRPPRPAIGSLLEYPVFSFVFDDPWSGCLWGRDGNCGSNGPHKSSKFAGSRDDNDVGGTATGLHAPVALA